VKAAREVHQAAQPLLDPARLVFIDETGTSTNMDRRYGRSPEGERLEGKVPHGHWKVTTLVAALTMYGIQAAMTVDGALNGDLFVAYVEQVLVPTLKAGDVVILDNLSSHKRAEAKQRIEACGASLVFLPAYSPDLNPIEMAFSKLKAILRKAKERTVEGLNRAIFAALEGFTPEECANFLAAAGYSATQTPKPL
jgi:transposase